MLGRTSYAGFFTVDEMHNSNMYFWFFPAQVCKTNAICVLRQFVSQTNRIMREKYVPVVEKQL